MNRKEHVRNKIAELLGREPAVVTDEAVLADLVHSSFLLVELVIELQEEFGVRFHQSDMHAIATIGQLLDLVDARMGKIESG